MSKMSPALDFTSHLTRMLWPFGITTLSSLWVVGDFPFFDYKRKKSKDNKNQMVPEYVLGDKPSMKIPPSNSCQSVPNCHSNTCNFFFFFFPELTKMDPGSSKTTSGSSNVLINSGPMSCNRGRIIKKTRWDIMLLLSPYITWYNYSPLLSCRWNSLWIRTVRGILRWLCGYLPRMACGGCGLAVASCRNSPCVDLLGESWENWVFHSQSDRNWDLSLRTQWLKHHISLFILNRGSI